VGAAGWRGECRASSARSCRWVSTGVVAVLLTGARFCDASISRLKQSEHVRCMCIERGQAFTLWLLVAQDLRSASSLLGTLPH
jgi:hypothetical protein